MLLEKYSAPTKFSIAPYKTLWKVMCEDKQELWIQTSHDDTQPDWHRLGSVLEKAFSPFMSEDAFMEMSLRLYKKNDGINH